MSINISNFAVKENIINRLNKLRHLKDTGIMVFGIRTYA
jgi:hypothetical protein